MKNYKGFAMGLVLGLALAISGLAFAQDATKNAMPDKAMSCCEDSCSMMKHDKNHDPQKHDGKEGCCSCCASGSCDMHMKDKNKDDKGRQ